MPSAARQAEKRCTTIVAESVRSASVPFEDERMWRRVLRRDSWLAQGKRCFYCKSDLREREATADHVIPKKAGGQTSKVNIKAACEPCNFAKGSMPPNRFKRLLRQPGDAKMPIQLASARYRIAAAADRACKRIAKAVGMEVR